MRWRWAVYWQWVVYFLAAALLAVPPLTYGQTQPLLPNSGQPLLPNSGQSLRNSAAHLTAWDRLSAQFETALVPHEQTLTELSERLKTSERSLTQSTFLLEKLSRQNGGLRNYNQQIGERMYERDMDLVDAYGTINRLEKTALKLAVAAACLAGAPRLFEEFMGAFLSALHGLRLIAQTTAAPKPPIKASCFAPVRYRSPLRCNFGVVTKRANPPAAGST
jgi:hypothetical protein